MLVKVNGYAVLGRMVTEVASEDHWQLNPLADTLLKMNSVEQGKEPTLVEPPLLVAALNVTKTVEPSSLNCTDDTFGVVGADSRLSTVNSFPFVYRT